MIEAFLIAALSLPATQHRHPAMLMAEGKVDTQYQELLAFIRHVYPDAEVHIQRDESETQRLKMWGWQKTIFRWRYSTVWIKRSA